jgi:hypothetical protein
MCQITITRKDWIEVNGEYVATIYRMHPSGYFYAWIHHDGIVERLVADTKSGLRKLITPIFA